MTIVAILGARMAGDVAPFISRDGIPMMVVVQMITGATGEELGWRGFLLPRLGRQFGEMRAAWMMAVFWALWHVPAFYTPGMPHRVMPMASTLLVIVLFGVFLGIVFYRSGRSVLATMLAHLSLNIMLAWEE